MIALSIFATVEFYVTAFILAAAIVAYFALPREKGPARQYLLAGDLEDRRDDPLGQALEIEVLDDMGLRITRHGIVDLTEAGAASLAVEVRGFDIEVKERITRSPNPAWPVNTALFTLDSGVLGRERYHLQYRNPDSGQFAATALSVKPGIKIMKPLL